MPLPATRGDSDTGFSEWWGSYHFPGFRRRPSYAGGIVVQHGVLDHGGEHEQEADGDEQVHRRHVGDAGERVPGHGAQRGHGQDSSDAWQVRKFLSVFSKSLQGVFFSRNIDLLILLVSHLCVSQEAKRRIKQF